MLVFLVRCSLPKARTVFSLFSASERFMATGRRAVVEKEAADGENKGCLRAQSRGGRPISVPDGPKRPEPFTTSGRTPASSSQWKGFQPAVRCRLRCDRGIVVFFKERISFSKASVWLRLSTVDCSGSSVWRENRQQHQPETPRPKPDPSSSPPLDSAGDSGRNHRNTNQSFL